MACASDLSSRSRTGRRCRAKRSNWRSILNSRACPLWPKVTQLVVSPRDRLTAADIAAITRWKRHILALLAYEPPTPAWVQ